MKGKQSKRSLAEQGQNHSGMFGWYFLASIFGVAILYIVILRIVVPWWNTKGDALLLAFMAATAFFCIASSMFRGWLVRLPFRLLRLLFR